jgi:hypothetical protein
LPDLLRGLGQQPFIERFYLGGGTALALQLGHRKSFDLDLFSNVDDVEAVTREEIRAALSALWPADVQKDVDGNLFFDIGGTHVGFFSYGYPLLEPTPTVVGVRLAAPVDIGLMKLDAVVGRGARKDFYDLYFIAQQVALTRLLALGEQKYPYMRDFQLHAVSGLTFFDNADQQEQPALLIPVEWEAVKEFFVAQARALRREWLGF